MLLLQADWIIVTVCCTDFQTLRSPNCKESRTLDPLPFHLSSAMLPLYSIISARYQSVYQLRSNDGLLLYFPRGKMLTSFGDRSFSVAAPTLWNALPISLMKSKTVQQFKSLLKTYLFKQAFHS